MQPRDDTAVRAAGHSLRGLDRVLDLTVIVRHSKQHKARKTEHRRRRATVVVYLGLPRSVAKTH